MASLQDQLLKAGLADKKSAKKITRNPVTHSPEPLNS